MIREADLTLTNYIKPPADEGDPYAFAILDGSVDSFFVPPAIVEREGITEGSIGARFRGVILRSAPPGSSTRGRVGSVINWKSEREAPMVVVETQLDTGAQAALNRLDGILDDAARLLLSARQELCSMRREDG